ncbi:MarR family transcriptional regulator [Dehalobacter sp. DCM]|uniref:MarR family winged helix-turn-helix transcriptional regulator n=1 Tax=Dehalobacter sp. DCM TaxID=2907827 RepID=UPI00308203F3|nr:MarR family transcriptional regulator [Dehalobacter sp. DCM]
MDKRIRTIYNLLQELSWQFGDHGFNGECCADLSLVEYMALKKILNTRSIPIQEIGIALNFTKSGATRIIDRLEQKGYVIREQSPSDGRVCCVTVTLRGVDTMTNIIERYSEYVQGILKEFEPEQIEQIENSLEMLVAAVQKNKPFECGF